MVIGNSRKLLSYIFTAILACSVAVLIFSTVLGRTLASSDYVKNKLITNEIVNQCKEQLDLKYEMLEAETNIPVRVFQAMSTEMAIRETLVESLDSSYSDSRDEEEETAANSAYRFCIEYLDGNEIKYKKADVKNAAEKAGRIYNETVRIKALDGVYRKIMALRSVASRTAFAAFICALLSVLVFLVLYSDKNRALFNIVCGCAGGGLGGVVAALLAIVFNAAKKMNITPQIVHQSQNKLYLNFVLLVMAVSLALCAASYAAVFLSNRSINGKGKKHIGEE